MCSSSIVLVQQNKLGIQAFSLYIGYPIQVTIMSQEVIYIYIYLFKNVQSG